MSEPSLMLMLTLLALAVWFWFDSMSVHEHALSICARACTEINAQLLDQTVALQRLGLARNKHGHAVWRRVYRFEYSLDGTRRLHGSIVLRGREVESLALQTADGSTQFH